MGRKKSLDGELTRPPAPTLVNVAVMAGLRTPLTYRVADSQDVRPGQRVLVPLGTREVLGVALEPLARMAPGVKVRNIARILDPEPLFPPQLLQLGVWIADYYLAPIGEVFRAMLPLLAETRRVRLLQLTDAGRSRLQELETSLLEEARNGEEAELLGYLAGHSETGVESVRRKFQAVSPGLVENALSEGLVAISEVERERGETRKVLAVQLSGGPILSKPGIRLSPVARRIIEALETKGPADDHRELLKSTRSSLHALRKLRENGLIELSESRLGCTGFGGEAGAPGLALTLTPAQATILDELTRRLERRAFSAVLLHGVTGSGKTEIYLRLIARCLESGRTALMLVPEIGLTPAVQFQFLARFGDQVAVLHSALTEKERHNEWWRVRRGEARLVLGTRSAVFAPLDNLGAIIVDEEHDSSYKQEETPRYHARDVAVVRAQSGRALAVLGSATPSLESYWNARQGKYSLRTLEERIGGRPLATVEIVDMRQEFRETHTQVPLSRRLREEIEAQLRARSQIMILLNRRGYSWFLLCRSCGQTQRCVNCSISLTYHRREHRLICHYCGYSKPIPSRCPECDSEYLHYVGEGTEKLEDKLGELFPQARVARLDRDVARRAGQFRKILSDFREGKIDILVGTQMIAKGHDFPGVTLVGVVSADTGLALPDFRCAERTFQLLTQAAGRAGRGENPGRVLVQTFYPEHYAVRLAADQNFEGFFSKEMGFRRVMHYPPCTALANVIAQDAKLERAARVAKQIGDFFSSLEGRETGFKVLGPSPAPLARIEGRFRIQFLVKAKSRSRLNEILRRLVEDCEERRILPRSVMIDVDPVSVM